MQLDDDTIDVRGRYSFPRHQVERSAYRRHRSCYRRIRLQACIEYAVALADRRHQRFEVHRPRHRLAPARNTFEDFFRTGEPAHCQQRSFYAAFSNRGLGRRLHHWNMPALGLRQRVVMTARDCDGVGSHLRIVAQQARRECCARKLHVGARMPAARGNSRRADHIAHAQVDFISGDQRSYDVAAAAPAFLRDCECRRKIAARMRRIQPEVVVVVVEIANQRAVDQSRQCA